MTNALVSSQPTSNSPESLQEMVLAPVAELSLDVSNHVSPCLIEVMVVIVNYRTPQLTVDCLKSLESEVNILPNLRVVVSDNDSADGSDIIIMAAIKEAGWSWAEFLPLERNGGFAYGNNFPIRRALSGNALAPYVLLLNPDTVVLPGAISTLVSFMEQHPEAGIVGSRLQDPDGTPQRSAFRFHTFWSEIDAGLRLDIVHKLLDRWVVAPPVVDNPCQTDWVAGASMMVRRQVFEEIGLIDEGYFMYYEEMDFSLQANKAGWLCWYVPDSRVIHLVGQSSGVTNTKKPRKRQPKYVFDSRRRYFIKNYGWLYLLIADLSIMATFPIWRTRRFLQRKPDLDPPNLLLDIFHNSFLFRGFKLSISPQESTHLKQPAGKLPMDNQYPIGLNNIFFWGLITCMSIIYIFAWLLLDLEGYIF